MYIALIQNTALLVALSTLYSLGARLRTHGGVWFRLYMGLLFGAVAVAGMMAPFHYSPGIIYDGRSIVLSMAGLFGGLTVAAISAIIAGAFRASLGGVGVWAGLATIVGCSLVGLIFRRVYGNRPDKLGIPALYVLGLIAHLVMLGCQTALLPWPTGVNVTKAIWLPVMLIYPVATVLMGLLLGTEDRRVRAEEALRESEGRFRRLTENAQDLIYRYELTPRRGFTYVSPVATAMTGYTPEEHYADPDLGFKIVHPDDHSLLEATARGEFAPDQPLVLRWIRKDGSVLWTEQRNVPIYDEQGNLIAIEGIARDITERKQAEEKIREQLTELQRWYKATLDREGRIIELKREVNELLLQAGQPIRYPSVTDEDEKG